MLRGMKKEELVQHAVVLTVTVNVLRDEYSYLTRRVAQLEAELDTALAKS